MIPEAENSLGAIGECLGNDRRQRYVPYRRGLVKSLSCRQTPITVATGGCGMTNDAAGDASYFGASDRDGDVTARAWLAGVRFFFCCCMSSTLR